MAAGNGFSLALNAAGVPYSWGSDGTGQLGNGSPNADRSTAAPLGTLNAVVSVAAGSGSQGMAVRSDGTVWAWGYGGSITCELGAVSNTPIQIGNAAEILAVSAGADHALMLRNRGSVMMVGCNDGGQLGSPPQIPRRTFADFVVGLPAIKAVAAGGGFSLALDMNGNVWSWGRGFLGDGAPPIFTGRYTPMQIAGLTNITAIAAGRDHALALRNDGAVFAWGNGANGKLGDGTVSTRSTPVATLLSTGITAIAAGPDHSLALRNDGVVLSWGRNDRGQLGIGSTTPALSLTPVVALTLVNAIAAGGSLGHSLALRSDGTVWAWGENDSGQLGNGSTAPFSATPVQVTGLSLN
jgi:alpha-tubulin suppressor-like RCC1 family protein